MSRGHCAFGDLVDQGWFWPIAGLPAAPHRDVAGPIDWESFMSIILRTGSVLLFGLATGAQAQTETVIRESADPAKAAAVERSAEALAARPVQPVAGPVHADTVRGQDLLSGGSSVEGRAALNVERDRYSLWGMTVAKPSGAYLADADLRIRRAGRELRAVPARGGGVLRQPGCAHATA